ncbi:hypothetical protein [Arthrobacter sp. AQ5-05]|uniref:hypothetical protein n=1 Tax=Arthrobacter sp. AQ5-05 TaxID=2184581 RepID=UPI001C65D6FC|nr:hypothetical protein [Arthrobacter sp. AQ5-05]
MNAMNDPSVELVEKVLGSADRLFERHVISNRNRFGGHVARTISDRYREAKVDVVFRSGPRVGVSPLMAICMLNRNSGPIAASCSEWMVQSQPEARPLQLDPQFHRAK